jgi:hypothetical protein
LFLASSVVRVAGVQTGEKVISCALSPDGKMIACSDTLAVKLFRLDESTSKTKEVRVTKHDIPNAELAAWYASLPLRAPCCPTQLQTALTSAGFACCVGSDRHHRVAWLGDNYLVTGTFNGGLQLIDMLPTPSVVASYAPDVRQRLAITFLLWLAVASCCVSCPKGVAHILTDLSSIWCPRTVDSHLARVDDLRRDLLRQVGRGRTTRRQRRRVLHRQVRRQG